MSVSRYRARLHIPFLTRLRRIRSRNPRGRSLWVALNLLLEIGELRLQDPRMLCNLLPPYRQSPHFVLRVEYFDWGREARRARSGRFVEWNAHRFSLSAKMQNYGKTSICTSLSSCKADRS